MTNTILLKRSDIANSVPSAANLIPGELALNYTDGNLFFKDSSNVVILLASTQVVNVSGNITGGNIISNGTINATGNVSADYFLGNGSQLSGIARTTFSSTPPVSPIQGDIWIDADTGIQYIYFNDGDSSQWAEMEAETAYSSVNVDLSAVAQNIVPAANVTYDLGTSSLRWRDLYLSGNTINLGGATITTDAESGAIALIPEPTAENPNPSGVVITPAGGVVAVATDGGNVTANAIANAASSSTAAPVPIDITTTPPENGQALIWDADGEKFVPGNVAAGGGGNVTITQETFTAANNQTTFDIAGGYTANLAQVYLNGVKLVNGVDVTVTSGSNVVLTTGAAANDVVDVVAYTAVTVNNVYTQAQTDALLATKASTGKAIAMAIVFGG